MISANIFDCEGSDVVQSFPLAAEFQTPLVKVTVDGSDYYLNDSDQYAQLGTTTCDGKLAVFLADQSISTIQAAKECSNSTETDYAVSLAKDGKARIEISQRFYGQNFNAGKKMFAEQRPEERRHYFQELVSGVAQGARPVSGLTTNFDKYPGVVTFAVELDNFAVVDGKYLYFNLPFTPSLFGSLANQRTLPMYLSDANRNVLKAEIDLPANYRATGIGPKTEKLIAPGGSLAGITQSADGRKLLVTEEFDTAPGVIAAKDYPQLLSIQSELGQKSGSTFLLQRD